MNFTINFVLKFHRYTWKLVESIIQNMHNVIEVTVVDVCLPLSSQ